MFASEHKKSVSPFWLAKANVFLKPMLSVKRTGRVALFFCVAGINVVNAAPGWKILQGHVPKALAHLTPQGRLSATNDLSLAVGLPLRDQRELDELIAQLYDPRSTNFHKYLTPEEFTARFGPTEQDYEAVKSFATTNGLIVTQTYGNRLVLDVAGRAADIERAFHVTLRTYRHPTENRDFFMPDSAPFVPTNLSVTEVWGLSDFARPHPLSHPAKLSRVQPLSGSGPSGYYAGNDFRNAYVPGSPLTGAGQTVGLLQFDGYHKSDITNYENTIGLTNYAPNYVPLTNVLLDSFNGHAGSANDEVCLDIEMAISMAPGLSGVVVYEGNPNNQNFNPIDVLTRMANDNLAKQLSSSWSWVGGPTYTFGTGTTFDTIFKQMAAQGQSYFQASGDSDAYTGSQTLDNPSLTISTPMDTTNITVVGGTTLYMNGSGASWSSETVWNYNPYGGQYANIGSGGGISTYYSIPPWQTNLNFAASQGSTNWRNIPDVALTADQVYVAYGGGTTGGRAGTSCAAPLWAGFCALVNQQSVASDGATAGFLNPALYLIGSGTNYAACFHDIATGNNIGTNAAGLFNAVAGYDLCTGWGTPNGTNLINALAPLAFPFFITQPASQKATNGANVSFTINVAGGSPLNFQWLFDGTNLPAGGNISGTTSSALSITAATTNNAGSYMLIVTNAYGSITSSVAILNVGFAPAISTQPTNLTIHSGSNAVFTATVIGSTNLVYQWQKNGSNLANGASISGATSNVLTLTAVTTNSSGSYNLSVTNIFGVTTSSVAVLTVVLPPVFTSSSVTNRTVQCGSNTNIFTVAASGTAQLYYQWSLDGTPVINATNLSYSVTNLHLPNHTVAVVVTNLYGSATNSALVTVIDTLAPAITLNGGNPIYIEFGSTFTDPGATAADVCAGSVSVSVSGLVTTTVVGTNTLTYTAGDGNGNTNTVTRTVIVRDTTPPTILWSFTNLVFAANTNCSLPMPDVTGTNFILATDLSEPLTISQSPTNNYLLPLGTNSIVITVKDTAGNASYSTNTIIIQDQTPPVIFGQPQSLTNFIGTTATFSAAITACTPLAFQWYSNNVALTVQTNTTLTLSNVASAAAGNYYVVATASGGATTSAVVTLTVNLYSTALMLASSENPSGFKDNLSFSAVVTPTNATGAVQFFTNGSAFDSENLAAGQAASTNISSLPRGTNAITAIYSGDANDLPSTNSLLQIITNHPPVALPAFYSRGAGTVLDIATAGLATNWSDVDGDTVSLAAIGVSTNGVTVTNNAGTLVYFNSNNVADQFVCTISDGFGGTNFQAINIAVVFPALAAVTVNPDGSFNLNLTGSPGYSYILQATTNLFPPGNWQPISTNTLGSNGTLPFTDTSATNFPQQFYRLELAP